MKRIALTFVVAVWLGGCVNTSGMSPEVALASECQSYAGVLQTLIPLKSKMSVEQVTMVDLIDRVNGPICQNAARSGAAGIAFDYQGAVSMIVQATRELNRMMMEVQ